MWLVAPPAARRAQERCRAASLAAICVVSITRAAPPPPPPRHNPNPNHAYGGRVRACVNKLRATYNVHVYEKPTRERDREHTQKTQPTLYTYILQRIIDDDGWLAHSNTRKHSHTHTPTSSSSSSSSLYAWCYRRRRRRGLLLLLY